MKKTVLILTLCFVLLFITSCSKESNTSPTPSPTATTTEELTFNLDKIYFKWYTHYKDESLQEFICNIDGYYEKEEGIGYFKTQESLETAFITHNTWYPTIMYQFEIVHNGEFDEAMLGNMSTAIYSRSDNQIWVDPTFAREEAKDSFYVAPAFDMEIIKEISNNPNVEYICFYPQDTPFSQPGILVTTEIPTEMPEDWTPFEPWW